MVQSVDHSEVHPDGIIAKIVLERDNAPDLRFHGIHVAKVSTTPVQRGIAAIATSSGMRGQISGQARWYEYRIYTAHLEGRPRKYVVEKIGKSTVAGETSRTEVTVYESGADLARDLGATAEWKAIYRGAHIDIAEDLE